MLAAYCNLILALKNDDVEQSKKAILLFINSMRHGISSASYLRLTDIKFRMLINAINADNLMKARLILKVQKNENNVMELNTKFYNPITGHLWNDK